MSSKLQVAEIENPLGAELILLSNTQIGIIGVPKALYVTGNISCDGLVFNAAWNDYADTFELKENGIFFPGKCYSLNDDGKAILTKKRADENCIGIASDTFAYLAGDITNSVPIGVAGRVAAFVDKCYKPGTFLTPDENGNLTKANIFDVIFQRCVAKFIAPVDIIKYPKQANRFWVKII